MKKRNRRKGKPKPVTLKHRQRALSRNMTRHELAFLRKLAAACLLPFDFQVLIGYYIADFTFPTKMAIIELDGSHHYEEGSEQQRWDLKRDAFLTTLGFTVLRIPNPKVGTWQLEQLAELPDSPPRKYAEAIQWATKHKMQAFKAERQQQAEMDESPIDIARAIGKVERRRQKQAEAAEVKTERMKPRLVKQPFEMILRASHRGKIPHGNSENKSA